MKENQFPSVKENCSRRSGRRTGIPCVAIFLSLLVLLPLFAEGEESADRKLVCSLCNEKISEGEYVILDEQVYHKSCYDEAKKCILCAHPIVGQPITDSEGNLFHFACYQKIPLCQICNKIILGEPFLTLDDGSTFHKSCYRKSSKCALCGKPLWGETIDSYGQKIHAACAHQALKCEACEKPILGVYTTDIYARTVCSHHERAERCFICDFPVVTRHCEDGRGLCARCADSAVFSLHRAEVVLRFTRDDLIREFGLTFPDTISLKLVDRKSFTGTGRHGVYRTFGTMNHQKTSTLTENGIVISEKHEFEIRVLDGLPEALLQGVLAHELVHIWQQLSCPETQKDDVREGVAELVSYLVHKKRNRTPWMMMIEQNEIEPYRSGFLKAKELMLRVGPFRFFDQVRNRESF